ncbi:hypothetical protein J3Q64DRAFT_1753755 [Phycomyces blakesleeanus]|uniref:Galactose oxidase n=2 Tax=Phycomyces blakesleeanus TaxID=4837 RepID=A0A162TS68_PHYB8|nr:hypothetical protein PHYBLDRAFT_182443 [Phycomyces blakesleeanus NRRL 1555(-)]OAD70622.1 hypothetical protein PHYBLDRAFT_182443 [Phycomyces blakesleeanus NRRL 1555(-)]|eukprot:XP_018288662.1 hypothetical protein PHYBLDRAFT_182443 [Phycomyces blakesleeanus NRRL 1555(-)]
MAPTQSWKTRAFQAGLFTLAFLPDHTKAQCNPGPTNRSDFSAVYLNNAVYVVGGSKSTLNVMSLDLSNGLDITCPDWKSPSNAITPTGGFQPFAHGVAFAGQNGLIYAQAGDSGTSQTSSVVAYNTTGQWSTAIISGKPLEERAEMTATTDPSLSNAFYYGGRTPSDDTLGGYNDLYSLRISDLTWIQYNLIYPYGTRPNRYAHTSTMVHNKLFIMGGIIVPTGNENLADSLADFRSVLVIDPYSSQSLTIATYGDIPPPKLYYSAVLGPDGHSIVMFGGRSSYSNSDFSHSQDVYVLDTCKLVWSKPTVSGTPPIARAGHEAVVYNQYMIVMLGYTSEETTAEAATYTDDVGILDMTSWKWVNKISKQVVTSDTNNGGSSAANPTCWFNFPSFPLANQANGTAPVPYDSSVILNPFLAQENTSHEEKVEETKKKGFGISFGLFGFLLILGAGIFYLRRQRRKARTLNPRWLPGGVSNSRPSGFEERRNDYPLFVYGNRVEKNGNEDNTVPATGATATTTATPPPTTGVRTYTASDNDEWERSLGNQHANPVDNQPLPRHVDVWDRMHSLNEDRK